MGKPVVIGGHDILAVERFRDETRHMIVYDVLETELPYGEEGARMRLFLSDEGYTRALDAEQSGQIKIKRHAAIIEGHILKDDGRKKKSRKGQRAVQALFTG